MKDVWIIARRRRGRQILCALALTLAATTIGAAAVHAKHGGGGLALPIIGGVAGGGLLASAIYQQHEISQMQGKQGGSSAPATATAPEYVYVPAQPVYAAPAYPAYDGGSGYGSIQGRLQELDSLCAQGLVSASQCAQRRQQILQGL